jgi:ABC-type branched-subunit amino acid transport system permease subunit
MMDDVKECPAARSMALQLSKTLMDYEPKTQNQQIIYAQMVSDCSQFWQNRRDRINVATNGIPAVEWVTLIVGAVIAVFFTYFFGLQNLKLQIVMTAMITTLISLNLFLVLLFGYPFAGDLGVSNKAFQTDQGIFTDKISSSHAAVNN